MLFQVGNIEKRNTYNTTIIINIMVRIMRKKEVYLSDMISLNPGIFNCAHAVANVTGSEEYKEIIGKVLFYQTMVMHFRYS